MFGSATGTALEQADASEAAAHEQRDRTGFGGSGKGIEGQEDRLIQAAGAAPTGEDTHRAARRDFTEDIGAIADGKEIVALTES